MWCDGEEVRFRETQAFAGYVYLILMAAMMGSITSFVSAATATPQPRMPMVIGGCAVALALGLALNLLTLKTVVTEDEIRVTFGGLFPLHRRIIPRSEIQTAESVTYSPIRDYGGWGIRGFGDNIALNAKGDRGVLLTLRDGKRVMVGSQKADELAEALKVA